MITVQSVLVEYEDKEAEKVYANSGFFFANRYVLTTSNILTPLLEKLKDSICNLKTGRLLDPKILFGVPPRINVVATDKDKNVHYKQGLISAVFVSEDLKRSCEQILCDWTVDYQEEDFQFKDLLSLFFIVEIAHEINHEHLMECFRVLWAEAKTLRVEIGQNIFIESVPFGNRNFLKSYSQGIVSNITGKDGCLILTDASSAPGSEGGPIFATKQQQTDHETNKFGIEQEKKIAFGIVISSLCWWKGEWTGLTLGANVCTIIQPLIKETVIINLQKQHLKIQSVLEVLENSVVQVTSGMSWGTAILVAKNIFVTNSHVIESDSVALHWKTKKIKAYVIFKTKPMEAYDLAVIAGNERDLKATRLNPASISLDQLRIGEKVFAAGFPLFERHLNPRPTLTSGHVSQVNPFMIRTTCSVLPGSSGGAILRPNGSLVGVIVCNTKLQNEESPAYPRINLAIPIGSIYETIIEFMKTEDVSILHKLQIRDSFINKQWNLVNCKL